MTSLRTASPSSKGALALFAACLVAQLYLVFFKSFNWDEFLHFSQIYQIRSGTFNQPLQVLHARVLWWAPYVSHDLVTQMLTARLFVWVVQGVTLAMIYLLARRFVGRPAAFFAAFAYLTAGYVFTQGFSIRADPMVTAVLMSALALLSRGGLSLRTAAIVGVMVGVAGMFSIKSGFYAPCFLGLLWLNYREDRRFKQLAACTLVMGLAAAVSFVAIYLWHTADLAPATPSAAKTTQVAFFLRWLTIDLPFRHYIWLEATLAPLFLVMILAAPFGWRRAGLGDDKRLVLLAFLVPLVTLAFYRNTFPYYFSFILAPAAVAIAPALEMVRQRFGSLFLALIMIAMPLFLTLREPVEVMQRQKAMIEYVHREYPKPVGYLDYSQMISDYPRVLRFLTTGNGMRAYREAGDPIVARQAAAGNLPFIIANHPEILAALEARPMPGTFLPEDLVAMNGQYVEQWSGLWREGQTLRADSKPYRIEVRRPGDFVLDGPAVRIDGQPLKHGASIALAAGGHVVESNPTTQSILWRGKKLPGPTPAISPGDLYTQF